MTFVNEWFSVDEMATKLASSIPSRVWVAMQRNGLNFRPYVWRTYFETHLLTASGRGIIGERYVKFLMGHKGDVDSVYSTHKNTLPEEMLEDMRKQYEKASMQFLETTAEQLGTQAIRVLKFRRKKWSWEIYWKNFEKDF